MVYCTHILSVDLSMWITENCMLLLYFTIFRGPSDHLMQVLFSAKSKQKN
jgi:hypothetical protein